MPSKDPQIKLRLTQDLKDMIANEASKNDRSMNAEIIDRLRASFSDNQDIWDILGRFEDLEPDLKRRLNELERKVDILWSRPAPYDEDHHRD